MKGQIQVIFGPMFAGKTTELIRRIKRYQYSKYKCIIVKSSIISSDQVITHDLISFQAISTHNLYDIKNKIIDFDVIGINEGQFFPDLSKFCEEMANLNKIIIVAALDGNYLRKPFGNILDIIPLAESVIKLSAICMNCQDDASFSKRITDEIEENLVGGSDKYTVLCRECYHQANKNNNI